MDRPVITAVIFKMVLLFHLKEFRKFNFGNRLRSYCDTMCTNYKKGTYKLSNGA